MKIAVCCPVKMENKYLDEWYDWYFNTLHVDEIFLYDNNNADGEFPIVRKNVTLVGKWRGVTGNILLDMYTHCYKTYIKDNFDWCIYADADEFLDIRETNNNLREFLSLEKFKDADEIVVNWENFDDNDYIYYDDKPCMERFTRKIPENIDLIDKHVKPIISGKTGDRSFNFYRNGHPHCYYIDFGKCIDVLGNPHFISSPFNENYRNTHKIASIKHYNMKTIDEYVHNKMIKGQCDRDKKDYVHNALMFFGLNKRTALKEKFLRENNLL